MIRFPTKSVNDIYFLFWLHHRIRTTFSRPKIYSSVFGLMCQKIRPFGRKNGLHKTNIFNLFWYDVRIFLDFEQSVHAMGFTIVFFFFWFFTIILSASIQNYFSIKVIQTLRPIYVYGRKCCKAGTLIGFEWLKNFLINWIEKIVQAKNKEKVANYL